LSSASAASTSSFGSPSSSFNSVFSGSGSGEAKISASMIGFKCSAIVSVG
jgi:hypothetical protein